GSSTRRSSPSSRARRASTTTRRSRRIRNVRASCSRRARASSSRCAVPSSRWCCSRAASRAATSASSTSKRRTRRAPSIGSLVPADSDVSLVLEGTYPYVSGGVSSWVHDIVCGLPELSFALYHLGPQRDAYGEPGYALPANVVGLSEQYLHEVEP